MNPLVRVTNLSVDYRTIDGPVSAVQGVSLDVGKGEVIAIVGESGSGKSTTAHALIGLLPAAGHVRAGKMTFGGRDYPLASERALRTLRGRHIGLVPQDPGVSLNPVKRVGEQVAEVLRKHGLATRRQASTGAISMLETAGLRNPSRVAKQFPHELSGGMRQRVLIAIAFAAKPELILADEPTSALDVTVQKVILDHLAQMTQQLGTSVILITHDLAVAADRADRVLVMSNGGVVEQGDAAQVVTRPAHAYTQRLLSAVPRMSGQIREAPIQKETDAPILEVIDLSKTFARSGLRGSGEAEYAVDGLSFSVMPNETVGLVGESGSGKSTTARLLLRLTEPSAGQILYGGEDITRVTGHSLREFRRRVQMVHQNPYASLDPRWTVEEIVAEPLRVFRVGDRIARRQQVAELLDRVGCLPILLNRKPDELSGGQRQRVAIARALALSPNLVVCDEPVSSLDVSVQAQVLDLFRELQENSHISYLFISHDLAVVRQIAHRVAVMRAGKIVEIGTATRIFESPQHSYTRELLDAVPGHGR